MTREFCDLEVVHVGFSGLVIARKSSSVGYVIIEEEEDVIGKYVADV